MFHVEHKHNISDFKCPVCGFNNYVTYLELKDYFLSKEEFLILRCTNCDLLITHPQPVSEELSKYYLSNQYLSHATDKKGFEFFIYNQVRNITLSNKFDLIKKYAKGNNLLDIGCATGVFLNYCKSQGYKVTGVEPNDKARSFAREQSNLEVFDLDYLHALEPSSQDIITMWHVLEHVPDVVQRMNSVKSLLKDNGTAFIALPNPASYDASYYREYWAAYDVPRHLYHFSKKSFEHLVKQFEFKIIDVIPMVFDSYYISFLSERYKHGNTSFLKALYRGWRSNIYAKTHDGNYSSLIYILSKNQERT